MEAVFVLAAGEVLPIALAFAGAVIVLVGAAFAYWMITRGRQAKAQADLEAQRLAAQAEAQRIVAQAEARAKTELLKLREKFDQDSESARQEIRNEEKRIGKREDLVDQKLDTLYGFLHEMVEGALFNGVRVGLIRQVNEKIVATALIGAIKEVFYRYLAIDRVQTPDREAVAMAMFDFCLRGLLLEPEPRSA